jgi:histidine ammonia-lyase
MTAITLAPGAVAPTAIEAMLAGPVSPVLPDGWQDAVAASRAVIAKAAEGDEPVYGVNTGFGRLASERIAPDQVTQLQRNLILSHAAGTGEALPDRVVRLTLGLKIASLARGYSGVRVALIEALMAMLAADCLPVVPGQGSVGASGDLAPLAHLAAPLLGIGEVRLSGATLPAEQGLARIGLAPIDLAAKEGLALINGTQVSTALALAHWHGARRALATALIAGAMATDAALGTDTPLDARIHAIRGQPGQARVAGELRRLLGGSTIRASHLDCDRVQDPYCLRCQPQVFGAVRDQLAAAGAVLAREANAVSDNPLVFADTGEVLSGGNFHAEPVALAADQIALALAEIGALVERQIAMLIDAGFSSLPPFLVADPGLNSGFMLAHVTAASLASELKSLAHPASVDSLPTSANQEDHVSMATFAARRLGPMLANVERILGIGLLAGAQGIELRRPLTSSEPLEAAHRLVRERVAPWQADRYMHPDIEAMTARVAAGDFTAIAPVAALFADLFVEEGGHAPPA